MPTALAMCLRVLPQKVIISPAMGVFWLDPTARRVWYFLVTEVVLLAEVPRLAETILVLATLVVPPAGVPGPPVFSVAGMESS